MWRAGLGAGALSIAAAFWPGIAGAATSPRWAVAALGLYWLRLWPALFAAYCFVRLDFDEAVHWAILAGLLSLGTRLDEAHVAWLAKAFAVGVGLSSALAIIQALGASPVDQIVGPAGLFLNKNVMGETACLSIIACCRHRAWSFAALAVPALAISQSRSASIAIVIAALLFAPLRWKLMAFGLCATFLWLRPSINTLIQRLDIWSDAARGLTLWGNGSYGRQLDFGFTPYLHNDWLQGVWELGVVGMAPLLVALAVPSAFVVALVVIGSFGFPLHLPATAALAAVVIGSDLRQLAAGERDLLRARLAQAQFR